MSMAEKFPFVSSLMKKFAEKKSIHAIRRDEGEYYQIKPKTKVCSRHFRENDFIKTLASSKDLRADAVPSVFAWTRTSPRKRKPPTVHENIAETSQIILEENETEEEPNYSAILVNEGELSTRWENMKMDAETQTTEPNEDIETTLRKQIADLKCELEKANRRIEALQNQLFTVKRFQTNDTAISFYTGFPNWDASMAVFRYLNPGDKGENITYWLSAKPNVSVDIYEESGASENKRGRSRTLRPVEEFFSRDV